MNTIITIARQFGSSGKEIGKGIADKFGICCYDKDLISRVAKESGFCEEIIENQDERPTSSFLYNLVMDTYSFGYNTSHYVDMPISQKIFLAQFDTIKKIAEEGPCVIVGRCADYALADHKNVINLFIYADENDKIEHIKANHGAKNDKEARDMMYKMDKQRQSYYNYYSSKKWGRADSYDLCVNSSVLGVNGSVDFICNFIEVFEKKNNNEI